MPTPSEILAEVGRQVREALTEALPQTEREAGVFLAGMAWALVVFCALLVGVSWLTLLSSGQRP